MRNFLFSAIALISAMAQGCHAEVASKVISGQATSTGVSENMTEKRAIADALENFLYMSGGNLKSSILSENGEIIFDRIHFQSSVRIIGFDVLGKQRSKGQTVVSLRVFFDSKTNENSCSSLQKFAFQINSSDLFIEPGSPSMFAEFEQYLSTAFADVVSNHASILGHAIPLKPLDYNSLLNATTVKSQRGDLLRIKGQLDYIPESNEVVFHSKVLTDNRYLESELSPQRIKVKTREKSLLSLNRDFLRQKSEVFDELTSPLLNMLNRALENARCKPTFGQLKSKGNIYTVNLGVQDGINSNSIFMLNDGSTAAFKAIKVFDNESDLVALTSTRKNLSYANKRVYLLE